MATQAREPEERPLEAWVRANAEAIRTAVERYGGNNPRLCGPSAGGGDRAGEVDILVDNVRLSLLRLVRLEDELARLLGVPVNVSVGNGTPARARRDPAGATPL